MAKKKLTVGELVTLVSPSSDAIPVVVVDSGWNFKARYKSLRWIFLHLGQVGLAIWEAQVKEIQIGREEIELRIRQKDHNSPTPGRA